MWNALSRLKQGIGKTRRGLLGRLGSIFGGRVKLSPETLDQIEELLIQADLGVAASTRITRSIEKRLKEEGGEATLDSVLEVIRSDIVRTLREAKPRGVETRDWDQLLDGGGKKKKRGRKGKKEAAEQAPPADAPDPDTAPRVLFVVGVNGTGKTTSIAKLAHRFTQEGHRVLLAAADTFRAAAVEQLRIWADRVGVDCVQQGQGADPAAVVHDALSAAAARGHDIVIVDTAGRLHTKTNLMEELGKMARVIRRRTGRNPETLLVVDANTGQNGLQQAAVFTRTVPVDGLILTKLDGTARGGIVVAIAETLGLPVRYVGVGEQADDLAEFDPEEFAAALFDRETGDEGAS